MNSNIGGNEIRPLTGIRGFAALWVFLYHAYSDWVILLPQLSAIKVFAEDGGMGVDLFFVLSGFILSYVYRSARSQFSFRDYRRFLLTRLARIYPNHLVTTLLLVGMVAVATWAKVDINHQTYPWSGLPFQLTMTHVWPFAQGGVWNLPAWSIGAEWFAYVFMFPVTILLLRREWSTSFLFAAGWLALVSVAFIWPLTSYLPYHRPWAIPMVCGEFIAGSLFFGIYERGGKFVTFLQNHASWIFLGFVAIACGFGGSIWSSALRLLPIPLLLIGLTSERSLIAKILSLKFMLWLGNISYALYLSHSFALQVLRWITPPNVYADSSVLVRLSICSVNLLLVLIAAALLYYLIELPSRTFIRSFAKGRKSAKATEAEKTLQPMR